MNLKIKKVNSILMLFIMVVSIFSPYTSLYTSFSATTVTSEVVSEIKSDDISEIEELSEVKSDETIFVENIDEYNSLIDNEAQDTLVVTKEALLKQTRASYNIEKYPHSTLRIEDFSSHWGQLMYFKVNGDLVFCIESTKDINNIAYDQSESSSYYNTLSTSVKEQINYISAYGISKYQETGNKDYLWATQLRIWKAIEPSKYNLDGGTSLQTELDVIKNLVNNHFNLPSFMGTTSSNAPTHTLKWNGTKYTLTLTDSNKVANYKLSALKSKYGDYTISKTGNKITISTTNHNAVKRTIAPKYTPYNAGSNKYYDGGQDVFQGSADPLPMYMKVEIEPAVGNIRINKTGKELSNSSSAIIKLAGAKFEIIDENGKVVRTGTTNVNGVLIIKNLPIGKYIVKEANAPNGYLVAVERNATVKVNETTTLNIKDEREEGALRIIKTGKELLNLSDEIVPLSGAEFEVIDSEGSVARTGVTDKNGELQFDGLLIGDYVVKEIGAPSGYLIAAEKGATVKTNEVTIVNIEDAREEGALRIIKTGKELLNLSDEIVPLSGAEFEVIDSRGSVVRTGVTDKNGELQFDGLLIGDYVVREVGAPTGYLIAVERNTTVNVDETTLVEISDERATGDLHITKQGEDLSSTSNKIVALAGAEFELLDSNGQVVRTGTTDSNGELKFLDLLIGNYLLREVDAPTGYLIAVDKDVTIETGKTTSVTIVDEPIRGKAKLQKVGSKECDKSISKPGQIKDCQTVLGNVDFNIYNDLNSNQMLDEEEDTEDNIVDTITTNESGVALSNDLKYGYYLARESMSLDNYYLNETVFAFKITENGEIVKLNNGVVIENIEKLGQVKITKIGNEIGNLNFDIVGLPNAEYTIYKRIFNDTELDVNSELDSEIDSESSTEEDEIVAVLISDENGNATSPLLSFGNYYVKETKAPEGYLLDETEYDFTIDNETYDTLIELEFEDEVITNEIEITKTDLATGDELEGAKLQVLDSNGTVVEEWISTREVHTFTLEYGDYIIMEEFAPEGYLPLVEGVKFSVTEDGIVQNFKIDNKLITNDIEITKVDVANGDELEGAELVVYDKAGDVFEKWTSTTEAYKFTAPYGEYSICETVAPEGYQRLSQCVKFEVTEDGIVQKFKIENELMPVIEETGQNSYLFIVFISLIVLVALKYAINVKKAIRE